MNPMTEKWTPKIHPLTRDAEPGDPMELVATPAQGDPDYMLECILEEFTWMGSDTESLLRMFRSPAYPVLHEMMRHFGEAEVRRRVDAILRNRAGLRFTEVIAEDDPELNDDHHGPELIELSLDRIHRC
jgi:hypothetical protein